MSIAVGILWFFLFCVHSSFGLVEDVNGVLYTYSVEDGVAVLGGREGAEQAISASVRGNVVLPSVLGGVPVRVIGEDAFLGCMMSTVTLPAGIETIEGVPFRGCTRLSSIQVHAGNASFCSVGGGFVRDSDPDFAESV